MIRKIVSALIDVAAIALAFVVSAVAFNDITAGVLGAGVVAAYGMWCFWDGITLHRKA